jgi:hypothetical protein
MSHLVTYCAGYTKTIGDYGWRNKFVTGGTGTSYGVEPETMVDFQPTNLCQMSYFPIIPSVSYKVYFN